jgi:hypothetical protein
MDGEESANDGSAYFCHLQFVDAPLLFGVDCAADFGSEWRCARGEYVVVGTVRVLDGYVRVKLSGLLMTTFSALCSLLSPQFLVIKARGFPMLCNAMASALSVVLQWFSM